MEQQKTFQAISTGIGEGLKPTVHNPKPVQIDKTYSKTIVGNKGAQQINFNVKSTTIEQESGTSYEDTDSDDDYKIPDDSFNAYLILDNNENEIENQKVVIKTLEQFISHTQKQVKSTKAKTRLTMMLQHMLKKEKKELKRIETPFEQGNCEYRFRYKTYQDFNEQLYACTRNSESILDDSFQVFVVQLVDYLANPSIVKKNQLVYKQFQSIIIPQMEKYKNVHTSQLMEIQSKIEDLRQKCYAMENANTATTALRKKVYTYFKTLQANIEQKEFIIRQDGIYGVPRETKLVDMVDKIPRLDQLTGFWKSSLNVAKTLNRGSYLEQAKKLNEYAEHHSAEFFIQLKHCLKQTDYRVVGGTKNNLNSIARKITQVGIFNVFDMIRATVYVETLEQIEEVYEHIHGSDLRIVKIINQLGSHELPNITLNVILQTEHDGLDAIIGEIVMRYCSKPINFYQNAFLQNLAKSKTVAQFQNFIQGYARNVALDGKFYYYKSHSF